MKSICVNVFLCLSINLLFYSGKFIIRSTEQSISKNKAHKNSNKVIHAILNLTLEKSGMGHFPLD
jgi:hypothetical protein